MLWMTSLLGAQGGPRQYCRGSWQKPTLKMYMCLVRLLPMLWCLLAASEAAKLERKPSLQLADSSRHQVDSLTTLRELPVGKFIISDMC